MMCDLLTSEGFPTHEGNGAVVWVLQARPAVSLEEE